MKLYEGNWPDDADVDFAHLTLTDGRTTVELDGCDWKDNPVDILVRLTARLRELGEDRYELVEIADGSDTLWYGIVPRVQP
jgi:hypothetical protein